MNGITSLMIARKLWPDPEATKKPTKTKKKGGKK